MCIAKTVSELKILLDGDNRKLKTVGFIPTMGYLHEGHESLIKAARENNELVVVSVFVNPKQFGPNEDYERYPRDIEKDYIRARAAGADILFYPEINEIYIPEFSSVVEVKGGMTDKLCAITRPFHFKGVTTVVTILLNIIRPDRAYFGQKDLQQAAIIKKMVRDLHIPVEIVVCPIIREADGLALSSRNMYLNHQERKQAVSIYRGLKKAQEYLKTGNVYCTQSATLIGIIQKEIEKEPLAVIEYIEILEESDFSRIQKIEPYHRAFAAVAVLFGQTRLIDNMILSLGGEREWK